MAVTASISLVENSYSIPNNTSSVTCKVTVKWTYGSYDHTNKTKTLTFNGTKYTTTADINPNKTTSGSQTLFNKTITVAHNSDGSKTVSASVSIPTGTSSGTVTASKSLTLTKIPRYATVTQTLTSKTETSVTIKWASDSTIDYIWYNIGGSTWQGRDVTDGTSGSYTISDFSPNTAYNIKTRVRRKDSQLTTDSSALAVTTYAYPYANSMPNFTIGNQLTIGIYNPLKRSVTVNILGADGSQISNDTTTGTSITGYNGETVVNRLYASIPNAKSGTYQVKVTYGSQVSTKTGGTYSVNANVCSPSIDSVAYEDVNSTITAITGNNQKIVRNKSTVKYTASGLTAQKSATVASCKVTVNGSNYNLTLSGSSATGGNAVIDSGSDVTATFTVTDSRGLTGTKTVNVQMLDWHLPTAIISIERRNNFYSETDIKVDADYSSVDGKNTISISYKAKKQGTSSYTVTGTLQDNVSSTVTIDNNYAWDFVITLTDRFGGTTTYNVSVSRGMPIIFFDRIRESVGVNCFPQNDGTLEVGGNTVLYGQLLTSFKNSVAVGSYGTAQTTVNGLVDEVRMSSGCMGSVSIGTAYTLNSVTIPTGWYNFIWIPHRSGGINGSASGDNCNYGQLLLFGMNNTNGQFIVRVSSSAISEVIAYIRTNAINDYVVSQGSTNGWYWRKWKSKKCELWKNVTQTVSAYAQSAFILGSDNTSTTKYPFTITSPITQAYCRKIGTGGGYISYDYDRTDYWSGIAYAPMNTYATGTSLVINYSLYVRAIYS